MIFIRVKYRFFEELLYIIQRKTTAEFQPSLNRYYPYEWITVQFLKLFLKLTLDDILNKIFNNLFCVYLVILKCATRFKKKILFL